jgi:hypothetical protein
MNKEYKISYKNFCNEDVEVGFVVIPEGDDLEEAKKIILKECELDYLYDITADDLILEVVNIEEVNHFKETQKVEEFKKEVEAIAANNFDDYDHVEYTEKFDYKKFNEAIDKINNFKSKKSNVYYTDLFTQSQMLDINIMYACIRTGVIESDLTKKLNDNWTRFTSEVEEEVNYYYYNR